MIEDYKCLQMSWGNLVKIGVLGLGHMGLPIARALHARAHEVFTWSRTSIEHPWLHSTSLETLAVCPLDYLVIASGNVRPGFGNEVTEINSTLALVPDSIRYKTTKLIYLSSGAIYGECSTPRSESDEIVPSTTYGISKAFVEKEFQRLFPNRFTSIRVGNVIDWQNPYGILAMAKRAKETGSLELYGSPEDCRDYLEINELCLMLSNILELETREEIVNIGSGVSITLGEIAQNLTNILPELKVRWNSPRKYDVSKTQLDVSKVRALTAVIQQDPRQLLNAYFRQRV